MVHTGVHMWYCSNGQWFCVQVCAWIGSLASVIKWWSWGRNPYFLTPNFRYCSPNIPDISRSSLLLVWMMQHSMSNFNVLLQGSLFYKQKKLNVSKAVRKQVWIILSLYMSYNIVYWHVILPTQGGQYSKANQGITPTFRCSKQQLTLLMLFLGFFYTSNSPSQFHAVIEGGLGMRTVFYYKNMIASFICRVCEWSACNLDAPKWLPCQPTRWSLALWAA